MKVSEVKTVEIHKDNIRSGDTIACNDGYLRTVCSKDISRGGFYGTTIFGNSYRLGTVLVKKAVI